MGASLSGSLPSGLLYGSTYDILRSPAVRAWRSSAVAPASAVWPSAEMLLAFPYQLEDRIPIRRLWMANGATVANGNVDVGIYDRNFNRIVAAGAVATSGSSNLQHFEIAETWLAPGLYYLAAVMTSVSDTAVRVATTAAMLRSSGAVQMASQSACPAVITPATMAQAYLPQFGFTTRAAP